MKPSPPAADLKLGTDVDPAKMALTEENRCKWMYQLLKALQYVHSRRVVHRDIKPDNLLVDRHGDIKLGDFGLARTLYCADEDVDINADHWSDPSKLTLYVVTRWYRPPEVLCRRGSVNLLGRMIRFSCLDMAVKVSSGSGQLYVSISPSSPPIIHSIIHSIVRC